MDEWIHEYDHAAFFARPHLPPRGTYNGVVFLNQVYIGRSDHALAATLISTYLSLFESSVAAGDLKSRLLVRNCLVES